MTDRQAIWIFVNGGAFDQTICDFAVKLLMTPVESDGDILTQDDLARAHGIGRKRLIRTAQALGITEELKEILKNKRKSRKSCSICGAQEMHSENVQ